MKRLLAIGSMLVFALAMSAQDGHDKDKKKHSSSAAGKEKEHHDNDADEHGKKKVKFTEEGEFASISAPTGPKSNFNLRVSRGSSSTSPASTLINFTSFQISDDNNTQTLTNIFGEIPNSAFTGTTTNSLALSLDTGLLDPAVSSNTTCTVDLNALTVVCGHGPLGTIQLAFHENGVQTTRILNLTEEDIQGPVTTLIHASSDNGTANAQGAIFGLPVTSSAASVGVNHQSSVTITRQ